MSLALSVSLLLAAGLAGVPALADSGKWKGLGALVVVSSKVQKIGDQSDHEMGMTDMDGFVFSQGDDSFLDKARYQVTNFYDTSGLVNGGYKTFTAANGDQVYAKFEVTRSAWPVFDGKWTLIGGTGKYKGITGSGTFSNTWTTDTTSWDVLEGDYKIP
jgi:hypothetical protein